MHVSFSVPELSAQICKNILFQAMPTKVTRLKTVLDLRVATLSWKGQVKSCWLTAPVVCGWPWCSVEKMQRRDETFQAHYLNECCTGETKKCRADSKKTNGLACPCLQIERTHLLILANMCWQITIHFLTEASFCETDVHTLVLIL